LIFQTGRTFVKIEPNPPPISRAREHSCKKHKGPESGHVSIMGRKYKGKKEGDKPEGLHAPPGNSQPVPSLFSFTIIFIGDSG